MEEPIFTEQQVQPEFDLEGFMNFARETRLANDALEKMLGLWAEWQQLLRVVQIQHGKNSWLAIWLPEAVETVIDKNWEAVPSEGFLLNNLAQYLCMAAVEQLLPQVADGGCAPAPKPTGALSAALAALGLGLDGGLNLKRKYAILTHYPFKGGCEICAMQENCPKAHGQQEFASIVLPGHERGQGA